MHWWRSGFGLQAPHSGCLRLLRRGWTNKSVFFSITVFSYMKNNLPDECSVERIWNIFSYTFYFTKSFINLFVKLSFAINSPWFPASLCADSFPVQCCCNMQAYTIFFKTIFRWGHFSTFFLRIFVFLNTLFLLAPSLLKNFFVLIPAPQFISIKH